MKKIFSGITTSHSANTPRNDKRAFTLSEVLITLGVIGVVAAMTMPILIQNHQKHETVTKLKKVYSIVNQAIKMSEAEYGDIEYWDITECANGKNCTYDEAVAGFNKYIGKYLKIIKIEQGDEPANGFVVYLADGSILWFDLRVYDAGFYLNKKAITNPNKKRNVFSFRLQTKKTDGIPEFKYNKYGSFEPYATYWDGDREHLIKGGHKSYGCSEQYANYCAKLIQYDGWQISKDYPW